ncbi:MAG: preprotein translocase subunit SecE [Acetobacteraceae bacterium]|nr:preprotein translocase subunit SecE [Acetobacteraceae bacterium]
MARFDPVLFVRQVRQEVSKVTWPTRKETLVTTGMVFAFVTIAATFFTVVDSIIGVGVRAIFGFGR